MKFFTIITSKCYYNFLGVQFRNKVQALINIKIMTDLVIEE